MVRFGRRGRIRVVSWVDRFPGRCDWGGWFLGVGKVVDFLCRSGTLPVGFLAFAGACVADLWALAIFSSELRLRSVVDDGSFYFSLKMTC